MKTIFLLISFCLSLTSPARAAQPKVVHLCIVYHDQKIELIEHAVGEKYSSLELTRSELSPLYQVVLGDVNGILNLHFFKGSERVSMFQGLFETRRNHWAVMDFDNHQVKIQCTKK